MSNIGYLVPVAAAMGSIVFRGPVTTAFISGAITIVLGVWLSDRLARTASPPAAVF